MKRTAAHLQRFLRHLHLPYYTVQSCRSANSIRCNFRVRELGPEYCSTGILRKRVMGTGLTRTQGKHILLKPMASGPVWTAVIAWKQRNCAQGAASLLSLRRTSFGAVMKAAHLRKCNDAPAVHWLNAP